MKVIEEADVRDGFARRITYHLPYSTRQVDRFEYTGPKQIAYCSYSKRGYITDEDFEKFESIRDLPEGKHICGECVTELSNQGTEDPHSKITSGKFDDLRVLIEDIDESG